MMKKYYKNYFYCVIIAYVINIRDIDTILKEFYSFLINKVKKELKFN